jgi:lambda family phage portal protein
VAKEAREFENWIDRTVAYFSPARGLLRTQYRLAYEAARKGRRQDGWLPTNMSSNAEIAAVSADLRNMARSLVRDNPHAKKGLGVLVTNKVGTGILAQADGNNVRLNDRVGDRWKRWCDRADITGKLDFYGDQGLTERSRAESGEVLVKFVPVRMADRFDVPFRLQVIEADFIDTLKMQRFTDTHYIRNGIEYENNQPVAYWLFDEHPGENSAINIRRSVQSIRTPAEDVLHLFKPLRPGQTRGITDFAAVILRLRALDDYDDAEVMRKKIAACLAAFVTTAGGGLATTLLPSEAAQDGSGRRIETFRPGMIAYPRPGESVTVADPTPSTGYREFSSVQLHAIAAGLEIPYELLTNDLSELNYSSLRGGLVQFKAQVEADQWQILVPQLLAPVWTRFMQELAAVDGTVDPATPATFTPPRFSLLDPAKEVPAMVLSLLSGIDSYPNVIRREGYDWLEKLDEIQEFKKAVDERGLVLTSDGRKNVGISSQRVEPKPVGAPTPPKPPAATPPAASKAA